MSLQVSLILNSNFFLPFLILCPSISRTTVVAYPSLLVSVKVVVGMLSSALLASWASLLQELVSLGSPTWGLDCLYQKQIIKHLMLFLNNDKIRLNRPQSCQCALFWADPTYHQIGKRSGDVAGHGRTSAWRMHRHVPCLDRHCFVQRLYQGVILGGIENVDAGCHWLYQA